MKGITLDGTDYDVHIVFGSLKRNFDFVEGPNYDETRYGTLILDTIGTRYSYSLDVEPVASNPASYDSFFTAISNPNRTHTVVMPYGQTTLSFSAIVDSGGDTYNGKNGGDQWGGLSLKFTPLSPQSLR